jgi:glycosyltransferase involved in cell wall biosynthesis
VTPNVSIIIATYNRAHLLGTALDSVLAQIYQDYEIIVADDGSSDGTSDLVASYRKSEKNASRLRYFYQDNQGKSVALNRALACAKGEWVAFLDSDDAWLPEKLERQFQAIKQCGNRYGACFTDGQFVNNSHMKTTAFEFFGQHYDDEVGVLENTATTLAQRPAGISIVTLVCRRELIQQAGAFDPDLRFTEDYDFLFRLALLTDFCFVNKPLVIIDRTPATKRHGGSSTVWDQIDFRLKCEQHRYEKWLALSENQAPKLTGILKSHLRRVHSGWANWHLGHGEAAMAEKAIIRALGYEFTPALLTKLILTSASPRFAKSLMARRGFQVEVF